MRKQAVRLSLVGATIVLLADLLLVSVPTAMAAGECDSVIAGLSGQIEAIPTPANLNSGVVVSQSHIRLFNEGLGTVTAGMQGFPWDGATYSGGQSTTPYGVPGLPGPGTGVCSVGLHFDADVSGEPFSLSTGVLQAGAITFDRDIIGVWVENAGLVASDAAFSPGTAFPADNRRDMEFNYLGDEFSIDPTRRALSITMFNHDGGFLDEARVILAAAPGGNTAPVAHDQQVGVLADTATVIPLEGFDGDGDELTYTVIDLPTHGALSGPDEAPTYTPAAGFVGSDVFTVVANDGSEDSNLATVQLTVVASPFQHGSLSVGATPVSVSFDGWFVNPVVVASVDYANNTTPVVARVSTVTATGFYVWLQNPSDTAVVADLVSWVVVEAAAWDVDGLKFEAQHYSSSLTDTDGSFAGESRSYLHSYAAPVVVGQVMSANDPDWSVFWARGSTAGDPPSASVLYTGKTVAEDSDETRADETVGFIVSETGHGSLNGVELEAGVSADSIEGVDDSPAYPASFSTSFSESPAEPWCPWLA